MLSKAIFIHSHINLAYKSPFIIRDLRSRTITAAAQAKDTVLVRYVTQLEQHTFCIGNHMISSAIWNK